jgi:hypothetical protein
VNETNTQATQTRQHCARTSPLAADTAENTTFVCDCIHTHSACANALQYNLQHSATQRNDNTSQLIATDRVKPAAARKVTSMRIGSPAKETQSRQSKQRSRRCTSKSSMTTPETRAMNPVSLMNTSKPQTTNETAKCSWKFNR